ncbi:hypothetical protein [Bradyrhizobium sp. 23]|uniref:hypothetical protein n=1 Tax=Bradyrhizobium sp. 23 TaxID=2782667 RepID=UPI001FF90FA2|nr:hypothetical protein [Bradyrhizobium sp. 23]MCK1317284.1 hypothetical protein [Bradyrhizobium sp. 23]
MSDIDRDRLLALGADLERAWESPGATRKRIIRSMIHEIVVRIRDEVLDFIVHWMAAARQSGWKCSVNQDERASPGS